MKKKEGNEMGNEKGMKQKERDEGWCKEMEKKRSE